MAIFSRGSQIQVTTTAGPQTSNPNQVGGTLCISIASAGLFGGYLRYFTAIAKILYTATNHAPGKAMYIDLKEGESSCFI